MATTTLIVKKSGKDTAGNVTKICGDGWAHTAATAISNIRAGTHGYRVLRADGPYVRPYGDSFLRSDPDKTTKDNLDNLPDC